MGEHTIDFDKVCAYQDLFAITGPTGSGKSTILNSLALCFYGRTFHQQVAAVDMISHGQISGQIECHFTLEGNAYKAHWSCIARKKDGSLRRQISPKRYLKNSAGEILSIGMQELLGLDFDQFRRCVVLPQNQFSKFLKATYGERKDILEKLYAGVAPKSLGKFLGQHLRKIDQEIEYLNSSLGLLSPLDDLALKNLEEKLSALSQATEGQKKSLTQKRQTYQQLLKLWDKQKAHDSLMLKKKQKSHDLAALELQANKIKEDANQKNDLWLKWQAQYKKDLPLLQEAQALNLEIAKVQELIEHKKQSLDKYVTQLTDKEGHKERLGQTYQELEQQKVHLQAKFQGDPATYTEEQSEILQKLQRLLHQEESLKTECKNLALLVQKEEEEIESIELKRQAFLEAIPHIDPINPLWEETLKRSWQEKRLLIQEEKEKHQQGQFQLSQKEKELRQRQENHETLEKQWQQFHLSYSEKYKTWRKEQELFDLWEQQFIEQLTLDYHNQLISEANGQGICSLCDSPLSNHLPLKETQGPTVDLTQFQEKKKMVTNLGQECDALKIKLQQLEDDLKENAFTEKDEIDLKQQKLDFENQTNILSNHHEQLNKQLILQEEQFQLWQQWQGRLNHLKEQLPVNQKNQLNKNKEKENLAQVKAKLIQDLHHFPCDEVSLDTINNAQKIITRNYENFIQLGEKLKLIIVQGKELASDVLKIKNHIDLLRGQLIQEEETLIALKKSRLAIPLADPLGPLREEWALKNEILQKDNHQAQSYLATNQQQIIDLTTHLQKDEADLLNLEKELASLELPPADMAIDWPVVIREEETRLAKAQTTCGEMRAQIKSALETKEQYQKLGQKQYDLIKERDRYHLLEPHICGELFRNWALGIIEEQILYLANEQLAPLSNGRYQLISQGQKHQAPLYIMDSWQSGAIRKIHTLSGGETFLVSLALALGLAHMLQGHKSIDCFFIDEGFGSLDDESLSQVLLALEQLQHLGKMIGVISHVKKLTNHINAGIHLKSDESGQLLHF